MKPPPKSVSEWKETRRQEKGLFVVYRDLYHSPAFAALAENNPAHALVLFEVFDQLNLEPKAKRPGKRKRGYKNGGIVGLPQNRLKAASIKSPSTQSLAKRRLVELGFLDVVTTGDLKSGCTEFRISNRWRDYPNVKPQKDHKPITNNLYRERSLANKDHPVHVRRREEAAKKKEPHSMIVCSPFDDRI